MFFLQELGGYELIKLKLLALYMEHLRSAEQIEPRYKGGKVVTRPDLRSGQHKQASGIYRNFAQAKWPSFLI